MTRYAFETLTPNVVLAHYHEVGLKGKNRGWFEKKLLANVRSALATLGAGSVQHTFSRIIIELEPTADLPRIGRSLGRVFGLVNFAPAFRIDADADELVKAALRIGDASSFETFAVRARKGYTSFEVSPQKLNEQIGQAIKDHTGARVNLDRPDWTLHIEIAGKSAYLYDRKFEAPGGLPVSSSGKVLALLSGGIDSPVAGWELAKRGARVDFIHFHGQPYTDASSARQASKLSDQLAPWLVKSRLWLVPFGEIQSEIVTAAPQVMRIVLYRRFMMRIAESLAKREGAEALVTGESLGQVASQTLPNIHAVQSVVEDLPILRPLIGRDKLEIEELARRIGTYEISTNPHQDCCVLFVPKRVTTRASIAELESVEAELEVEALVSKGLEGAELQSPA